MYSRSASYALFEVYDGTNTASVPTSTNSSDGQNMLLTLTGHDGDKVKAYRNNQLIGTSPQAAEGAGFDLIHLGRAALLDTRVYAAILVYCKVLSDGERNRITKYLNRRYNFLPTEIEGQVYGNSHLQGTLGIPKALEGEIGHDSNLSAELGVNEQISHLLDGEINDDSNLVGTLNVSTGIGYFLVGDDNTLVGNFKVGPG